MQRVPGDGVAGQGSQRSTRLGFVLSLLALALTGATHTSARSLHQQEVPLAAAPIVVDSDGDGMPDDWETFFGLNPHDPSDAAADPDHDGLSNLQEYQQGDHPFGADAHYFAEGATGFFRTDIGLVN